MLIYILINIFSSSIILFSIKLVSWFCLLTTICLLHQVLIYILINIFLKFHHTIFNKTCQLILPFNHNLSSSPSADLHINKLFLKFHHTIFNKTCQLILPFNHNLSSSPSAAAVAVSRGPLWTGKWTDLAGWRGVSGFGDVHPAVSAQRVGDQQLSAQRGRGGHLHRQWVRRVV